MALTKETKIAKIEMVGDFKIVHIAYDEIVKEDGVEISKRRLRDVVDIGRLAYTHLKTNSKLSSVSDA